MAVRPSVPALPRDMEEPAAGGIAAGSLPKWGSNAGRFWGRLAPRPRCAYNDKELLRAAGGLGCDRITLIGELVEYIGRS